MSESIDDRYRRILAKQLVMNEQTWKTLVAHGLTESSEVRLDFAFAAPDRRAAESLKAVLVEQTDYAVEIESTGNLLRKTWSVIGSTQATPISPAVLDQWVDWMVTAGLHQDCEFDGWGTQV
jgi:hypothetical protein